MFVARALDEVEHLTAGVFQFVLDNLTTDTPLRESIASRLGKEMWVRDPKAALTAFEADGILATIANIGLQALPANKAIECFVGAIPSITNAVLKSRPDLFAEPSFWHLPNLAVGQALDLIPSDSESIDLIVGAMIAAKRGELAAPAVMRFGALKVLGSVEAAAETISNDALVPWFEVLSSRPSDLAAALVAGVLRQKRLLVALAEATDPDALPSTSGIDPWVVGLEGAKGSVSLDEENYLAAFLFCRALGVQSRSIARLLALSTEQVHTAIAFGRIPWRGWHLISKRLPWVLPWLEWDRCARIRGAAVDRFVGLDLDHRQFVMLTADELLWRQLVDVAVRSYEGRRYLDRVLRETGEADYRLQQRAQYIRDVLA